MYFFDLGELILFDEIVARLNHNVVFVAQNRRDAVCNPLLHQVNIDLLDVDFFVKLGWKFGSLEALLVDTRCHIGQR